MEEDILKTLLDYHITKEDITKDFKEYTEDKKELTFEDVNDYISNCYYDVFNEISHEIERHKRT